MLTAGLGPSARAGRSGKEEQTQAAGSGAGTKPPLKEPRVCTADLRLRGAAAGHGVASSDPQEEPPGSSWPATSSSTQHPKLPGDAGNEKRCPACCGLCSTKPLPPSRDSCPAPLWLQYSTSLSAFEFQSKPDCKQMDGVIKIPQAGSKEAHGRKREAPLEERVPAPLLGACRSGHPHPLGRQCTKHAVFPLTCPNRTWFSGLSTRPGSPGQPSTTSNLSSHQPLACSCL